MTSNLDYKKYSLNKLQEWVHDALSCGEASPHEIYSAIREAAQEDYQCYKYHAAQAFGLLELLSGHRPVADDELHKASLAEKEYYKDNLRCDVKYDSIEQMLEHHKKEDKVTKWQLPVEADPSGEYFVTFPDDLLDAADLKEGDTIEWVDQGDGSYLLKKVEKKTLSYDEAIRQGWTMTADGFWIKEEK